jgi:hypothetical protein
MNTSMIILEQTHTGAILEILVLLVIAGLIGYLTAFYYDKSVYTKKIKILEGEKAELKNHIEILIAEKLNLEASLKEKNAEIEGMKKPKKKES